MQAPDLQPNQITFLQEIENAWKNQQFIRLILSQYKGETEQLEKITVRSIELKAEKLVSVLYKYKTKDITKNYTWNEFEALLSEWIMEWQQLNLFTPMNESQLKFKKQQWILSNTKIKATQQLADQTQTKQHDREKKRWIEQDRLFLQLLGITDHKQNVVPSMARKWKQINKFVEIFSGAIQQAEFDQYEPLHVVDFGSGKGYLTCAIYDYLQNQHYQPKVTGVELRPELVEFCQNVADQTGYSHLKFFEGDVRSYHPEKTDVMIALHACDIATDFAIHTGIRLGAKVVMCSPCCHKELRPQLKSPQVLQPMLQYGLHAGQQAEMLTDTLRALFLQAYGYETKVLEFVSLEHTSKNKMILAIKVKNLTAPDAKILQQIEALKDFYSVKKQSLQLLLNNEWDQQDIGCKC